MTHCWIAPRQVSDSVGSGFENVHRGNIIKWTKTYMQVSNSSPRHVLYKPQYVFRGYGAGHPLQGNVEKHKVI